MILDELAVDTSRLVLLVDAFSAGVDEKLDGLTKLAKLDFLLRYPSCLDSLNRRRRIDDDWPRPTEDERVAVDAPMIRYRYGPWDNLYYALVGGLVGCGTASYVSGRGKVSLRVTETGHSLAEGIRSKASWQPTAGRVDFLVRHYDLPGTVLKDMIYGEFPKVETLRWRTVLETRSLTDD
jgi:hypothetical protein